VSRSAQTTAIQPARSAPAAASAQRETAPGAATEIAPHELDQSPPLAAQRAAMQHIEQSPRLAAQRVSLQRAFGPAPVQREIDTDTSDWGTNWEDLGEDGEIPENDFAGIPLTASRTIEIGGTTAPHDVDGMDTWRNKGYLADPAKNNNQTLTRMHAIRGRFGGPSAANNMFLGTAPSNNFNDESHYKQVEKPLQDFLNDEQDDEYSRAVDYAVTPNTNSIPAYMQNRIDDDEWVDPDDVAGFTSFANAHVPDGFDCEADLYIDDKNDGLGKKSVSHSVSTTIDADDDADEDDD
jgi:hypothetical protein